MGEAASRGTTGSRHTDECHLGFAALQPVVEEDVVGTEHVGGKGVLPDRGVWGLVQVGQVLQNALAEVLQSCCRGEGGGCRLP